MNTAPSHRSSEPNAPPAERLDSWKEIAAYLNRSVRTVHRWEKEEGLPVHRHLHKDLGSVFAYKHELDAWFNARTVHSDQEAETNSAAAVKSNRIRLAAALLAAVALIATVVLLPRSSSEPERDARVAGLELLSTFAGSHRWPALSPDGRTIAFVSDAGGNPQVWIKNVATGNPVQITFGDVAAARPRWSGDRIVYSRSPGGIWSVPPLGGEPRLLVKDGWNADVSADGKRIVFERSGQIFIAGVDGAGESQLPPSPRRLIDHYGDSWPTFSPDGSSIALFLGEQGRYGDYWVVPTDGSEPRRITSDFHEGGAPAWTPDGKSLIVSSARSGSVRPSTSIKCVPP